MKRKTLSLVIVIVGIVFGLTATQQDQVRKWFVDTQPGLYYVESVSDGDTIVVDMNGQPETIRFIGVDTPETHHPSKPVQCFGRAASDYIRALLEFEDVRLEVDPQSDNRDRYNRLLRYVYHNDQLVNKQLIAEGYGFAYTAFPHSMQDSFKQAQAHAKETKAGLWGGCDLEINQYGSYETSPEEN